MWMRPSCTASTLLAIPGVASNLPAELTEQSPRLIDDCAQELILREHELHRLAVSSMRHLGEGTALARPSFKPTADYRSHPRNVPSTRFTPPGDEDGNLGGGGDLRRDGELVGPR